MALYEKYGEFDSYEEINMAAANQKAEGDLDAVREIAKENGIEDEDVEAFINGEEPELCSALMAAEAKIRMEKEAMGLNEIMADWADYVIRQCQEHPDMAVAVRRKGKSLAGAIGAVLKKSWQIKSKVPKEIVEAAGVVKGARVEMGIPGYATVTKILKKYYLEG